MLRRLAFVPLAALGLATAFLVTGAGGAVTAVALVSVGPGGAEANAPSFAPRLSGDGRYVVFASDATNLAGSDPTPAVTDIFVRDLQGGTTERVTAGNGASVTPSISRDGRWIAFQSTATNLVPVDTNGCVDVFLFDRDTDTLIAVTHGNGNSGSAAVSGDGSAVAFSSFASDLVPFDTATGDVFRWDRLTATMSKASVSTTGVEGDNQSSIPNISDDGDVIVFNSLASNLIPGDTNGSWDVFVHDVSAGTTEAASVSSAGVLAGSSFFGSGGAQVSPNGRFVAFNSAATNLVPGTSGTQIFLRDLVAETTTQVSAGNGASGGSGTPSVTDDGRVAFTSFGALVADDTNFRSDVYLSSPLERVSVTDTLGQGTSSSSSNGASSPTISADGSIVVVQNSFSNVIAGATTVPNLVGYTLGSASGGSSTTTATTSTTTPTTTTLITTPVSVPLFRPPDVKLELTVEPAAPLKGESYAPGELFAIELTVKNVGTDTAHGALINQTLTVQGAGGRPVETTFPDPQCAVLDGEGGVTTFICSAGNLAPGASRTFRVLVRVHGEATAFASTIARSEETVTEMQSHDLAIDDGSRACATGESCESGAGETTTSCAGAGTVCKYGGEGVMNTVCRGEAVCGGGPERETHVCSGGASCKDKAGEPNVFRCSGEGTFCAGVGRFTCTDGARCVANGESMGRCEESSCSWGAGDNEDVVCVESDCWLNGGDDAARCLSDSTCRYGSGDDDVVCRSGSDCFAGAGRDELNCSGAETTCNAGFGRDEATCRDDATCSVWGARSEVTCEDGRVDLRASRSTTFMTDCTAEVCECPRATTSDFYVNRHSKVAARRLARPDVRLVGPGTVVTESKATIVQVGNRKPNIVSFANATEALGTVVADARDKVSARSRVILDNFNDEYRGEHDSSFDREQHPWYVPRNVHVITVDEPADGNASFGVIRIPVERVRPGGDVGVVLVPHNVPRGMVMGGTIARTDAAIGRNGLGDGTVVVRTHLAPHVFETKGRASGQFAFDFSFTAANASGVTGVSTDADAVRVGVYLFDEASGKPLTTSSGASCASCSVTLAQGERKSLLSVDNLASADRADLGRLVKLGYSVLTVDGRPDEVNVQSFVVNAHTSPFDLSVFGFAPEAIREP